MSGVVGQVKRLVTQLYFSSRFKTALGQRPERVVTMKSSSFFLVLLRPLLRNTFTRPGASRERPGIEEDIKPRKTSGLAVDEKSEEKAVEPRSVTNRGQKCVQIYDSQSCR